MVEWTVRKAYLDLELTGQVGGFLGNMKKKKRVGCGQVNAVLVLVDDINS